jgi:hypothetical protein
MRNGFGIHQPGENAMQTKHEISTTPTLGEAVETAYQLGSAMTPDRATAVGLAARRLERVLVRGRNERLALALADLARDLAPTGPRAKRAKNPDFLFVSVQQIAA